jgi:hypothetical protein
MDTKKLLIIIGCVVMVLIIAGVIVLVRTCSNDEPVIETVQEGDDSEEINQRRINKLLLAETYFMAGQYDMALSLINELLIENFDDEDARALQRIILSTDRSGGQDALLEAQQRLIEEFRRSASMNINHPPSVTTSVPSGSSAAEAAAAAAAAEAARRAAEQEERQRLLDSVAASLQEAADASQGISSGSESVEQYDSVLELD